MTTPKATRTWQICINKKNDFRSLDVVRKSTVMLVSFAAVFSDVTQRSPERSGGGVVWHPERRLHRRLHTGIDHLILTTPCAPVWAGLDWLSYVSINSLFTRGRYCLLSFWLRVRQNKHWDISTDVEVEAFWQTNFTFPKHVSFSFFICIRPFTAHFFKEENFGWKRKHKALLVLQVQLWGHGLDVTGATCIVMFCFNDWRYPAVLILLHFLCLVMLCCTIFCFVELSCTIVCFVVLSCTICVLCCAMLRDRVLCCTIFLLLYDTLLL